MTSTQIGVYEMVRYLGDDEVGMGQACRDAYQKKQNIITDYYRLFIAIRRKDTFTTASLIALLNALSTILTGSDILLGHACP